jgi:hypothetical protein
MTKAYLTPPKGIRLPTGGRLRFGMIIGGDPMQNVQRPLNSSVHPRNGSPKRTVEAQPVPGMKRQTPDSVFTGPGQSALEDEPNLPIKSYEKPIPLHPSTTAKQRATIDPSNDPKAILSDASNMARRPPEKA